MLVYEIVFILFGIALTLILSGAIGMHIMGERGGSASKGFLIGLIPIFGPIAIFISFKSTDKQIIKEMYDRDIIDLDEYEKQNALKNTNSN